MNLPSATDTPDSVLHPQDDVRGTWGFRPLPDQRQALASALAQTSAPSFDMPPARDPRTRVITREEWLREGIELFGPDKRRWTFRCPCCGHPQSVADFLHHRLDPQGKVFRTCLSAFLTPGAESHREPCTYSLADPAHVPEIVVLHEGLDVPVMPFARHEAPRFRAR